MRATLLATVETADRRTMVSYFVCVFVSGVVHVILVGGTVAAVTDYQRSTASAAWGSQSFAKDHRYVGAAGAISGEEGNPTFGLQLCRFYCPCVSGKTANSDGRKRAVHVRRAQCILPPNQYIVCTYDSYS